MQMQGEEVRGRKCCERFCGETSADGMNALACVVLTVLTLSAASASDVRDPVRLVENTNYYATLPGGALEQHQYAFVAAAATAYNVRITRHEPFADRMNAQRLCVSPNSSSSPAPLCIPFVRVEDGDTEDEEDSGATIGLYSVTVVAPAAGTAYAVTVASTGGGFSYTVRYCRGQCTPQCTADCSGHGGCPAAGLWCACDAGYRGRDCAARRSPGSEDDSSDWLGPLLARLLAALVWGFLALVGAALLAALVAALLAASGRSLADADTFLCGKPAPDVLWPAVRAHEPAAACPDRVLMVGDSPRTDIRFGRACGVRTMLVLSGNTPSVDAAREAGPDCAPDFVAPSLAVGDPDSLPS